MMKKTNILFLLFLCFITFSTSTAQAATSGTDILEKFTSGKTSEAVSDLSKIANIPTGNAQNLLSSLTSNSKIDLSSGGELLNGLIDNKIPLNKLSDVTGMLNNLKTNLSDPKNIQNLVTQIGIGALPPEFGKALSTFNQLGELKDIKSIQDAFNNGAIKNLLSGINLPADALKAITDITKIIGDVEALKDIPAKLLADALSKVIPPNILALFSGGLSGLINGLTGSLGSAGVGGGGGGATGGYTAGKYEINNRDPKGSPVPKNCDVGCSTCTCKRPIENNHIAIRAHNTDEFIKHRNWMIDELFTKHILPAMMMMTSQMNVIAVEQTQMIGRFFDAKHQLETQRLFQTLMAEAHKDYQPSEGLCEIGTNVRSLASSEAKSDLAHVAFSKRIMDRQLRSADTLSSADEDSDIISRIHDFTEKYCNKADNVKGLNFLCANGGNNKARMNKDADFTRTIETKLTLDIDLSDSAANDNQPDLEDAFALSANLFAHDPLPPIAADLLATNDGNPKEMANRYMDLRAIAAKRSVAQNSFSALVSERASGDEQVAPFLKKLVSELGVPDDEIEEILGKNPSYFAQMEVLTKDIYQNPVFYTELYDKPANVLRKEGAIRAISLMQERDLYESQLRSEAVLAVMLETMLNDEQKSIYAQFNALGTEGE